MTDVKTKKKISASLEDYLEAIYSLSDESGTVRVTDIAETLKVSKPSVTGALRLLNKKNLVNYHPYECVTLTKQGEVVAQKVLARHNILRTFFVDILNIDADVAGQVACKAEHTLGQEVVQRLLQFVRFVTKEGENGNELVNKFKKFCTDKSGK